MKCDSCGKGPICAAFCISHVWIREKTVIGNLSTFISGIIWKELSSLSKNSVICRNLNPYSKFG